MMNQSKNYYVFYTCLGDLSVLISQIESHFPPPKFVEVGGQRQFRFSENTVYHVAFLKSVRMVSGLYASLALLPGGYYQEIMVVLRTVDDFSSEILFILENAEQNTLSDAQKKFMEDFFQEEFVNPNNPLENTKRRSTVPKRKIWASAARQIGQYANPSDAQKILQVTNDAFSGYVHGAYPQIMELCGGKPPRFHINGVLASPRIEACFKQISFYLHRTIMATGILTKSLGLGGLADRAGEIRDFFEAEIDYEIIKDISAKLKDIKQR
jgi:hypothetical protein